MSAENKTHHHLRCSGRSHRPAMRVAVPYIRNGKCSHALISAVISAIHNHSRTTPNRLRVSKCIGQIGVEKRQNRVTGFIPACLEFGFRGYCVRLVSSDERSKTPVQNKHLPNKHFYAKFGLCESAIRQNRNACFTL